MKKCIPLLMLGIVLACDNPQPEKKNTPVQTYEPKFNKEGVLSFLNADKDSVGPVLEIEVARTAEEQQYGMMYRKSIPENTGMLFFRPREEQQSFWMRNTYVPLDIIYIRADSSIVNIVDNAIPLTDQSLPSLGPALYVLEVTGGFCAQHGIIAGFHIRFREDGV